MTKGPPKTFTPEQLKTLLNALRRWNAEKENETAHAPKGRKWNQEKLGELLGVTQQVAGRYLGTNAQGLSYPVARRIAALFGQTLEEFFSARGVSETALGKGLVGRRDLAMSLARQANVSEPVIERVLARYDFSEYSQREVQWWLGKFLDEARDVGECVTFLVSTQVKSGVRARAVDEAEPKKKRKARAD